MREDQQNVGLRNLCSCLNLIGILALIAFGIVGISNAKDAEGQIDIFNHVTADQQSCQYICLNYNRYEVNTTICCADHSYARCKSKDDCKNEQIQKFQSIYDNQFRNVVIFFLAAYGLFCIYICYFRRWCCRRPPQLPPDNRSFANFISAINKSEKNNMDSLYQSFGYDDSENQCSICLQLFNDEKAILLKCGHIFHSNCIRDWGKKQQNCPICRSKQ